MKVNTNYGEYEIIPVKTKVIRYGDSYTDLIENALSLLQKRDYLFISEKVISILQGRMVDSKTIKPSFFAKILSKFVSNTPGSNLTNPKAMELVIKETGLFKILWAAFLSVITKPFGKKGVFYIVAGETARGIDAPDPETLDEYVDYISMAPLNPDKVAKEISQITNTEVVIIDANYRGVNTLGVSSEEIDKKFPEEVFKYNPLGQKKEQTPLGIVRRIN